MLFEFLNYWAILSAAVLAFGFGALWYGVLFGRAWADALGKPLGSGPPGPMPTIVTFGANLVAAFMTAVVQTWVGIESPGQGVGVAAMMWLGFAITSILPGIMYAGHSRKLIWIDGGYLLGVFLVMGFILGTWR